MSYSAMTLGELFALKSGNFEEYKKLLTKKHWLESHIRGAGERKMDAEESMSVFSENEHDNKVFLKYKADYIKASKQLEKLTEEYRDVSRMLLPFMEKEVDR